MARIKSLKESVIQAWKPELQHLGFTYDHIRFCRDPDSFFQWGLWLQRNMREPSYRVNLALLVKNPLIENPGPEVVLMGCVCEDGVHLHHPQSSWWPEKKVAEALEPIKRYATPWFLKYSNAPFLADLLERAMREKKQLIEILEPLAESEITVPWLPINRFSGIAPIHLYLAAIMHFISGNRAKALKRAQDWSATVKDATQFFDADKIKAQTMLNALNRHA